MTFSSVPWPIRNLIAKQCCPEAPTPRPTAPTPNPSKSPTSSPTPSPTKKPTKKSKKKTPKPTPSPISSPTRSPTKEVRWREGDTCLIDAFACDPRNPCACCSRKCGDDNNLWKTEEERHRYICIHSKAVPNSLTGKRAKTVYTSDKIDCEWERPRVPGGMPKWVNIAKEQPDFV